MALKLLQPGIQPLGQFDGLDSITTSLKGGEVVTFTSVVTGVSTDKASWDVFDGYVTPNKRTVVTTAVTQTTRPLMLADEGTTGYGTLFGSVVGGTVGLVSTGGAVLGPHTATGSGKVTCWDKPGLYAVSLDACDTTASDGLVPTNTTLATGAALSYTSAGVITPSGSGQMVSSGATIGHFVEFVTNGSLVTTPNYLASALSSARTYAFAVFHFHPQY